MFCRLIRDVKYFCDFLLPIESVYKKEVCGSHMSAERSAHMGYGPQGSIAQAHKMFCRLIKSFKLLAIARVHYKKKSYYLSICLYVYCTCSSPETVFGYSFQRRACSHMQIMTLLLYTLDHANSRLFCYVYTLGHGKCTFFRICCIKILKYQLNSFSCIFERRIDEDATT